MKKLIILLLAFYPFTIDVRLKMFESQLETLQICNTESTFKSYMDYRAITDPTSDQWNLQQQASTNENGMRVVDDYLMVAIASQYGAVGQRLIVTLENIKFKVIIGDIKANTTCTHPDGSMIEFIVDTDTMDRQVRLLGNYNIIYTGPILKIEKEKS